MSLNPDSTDTSYTLGRLFSVLEAVQSAANPGVNATIKDRYFNAASAIPDHIFPILLKLSQKHLKKLKIAQKFTTTMKNKLTNSLTFYLIHFRPG